MSEISYLESDQDFEHLIPLIKMFSVRTKVPYWQQLGEVASSFTNPNIITLIGKRDGKVVGYICGTFISQREFMVDQIFSLLKEITLEMASFLESELKKRKIAKIMGLSKHDPRVFEKYGYKIERYLITKQLETEEK